MRRSIKIILTMVSLCAMCALGGIPATAQTISKPVVDLALKSGESTELSDLWWVGANCKSLLTKTPEVEILDGPPSVTAVVKPASVVPRGLNCTNAIQGGKLVITAGDVQDPGTATLLLRVNFKTKSGDRQRSVTVRLALVP